MEKKEEILRVRNLDISFETTAGVVNAVRGVNLTVNRGETVAIVGESGSGKSVSAKAIMGILAKNGTIDRGQITFSYYRNPEERVTREILQMKKEEIRRHINGKRIAMVFQDPMTSLNPVLTVGDQIAEVIKLHDKISEKEAEQRAGDMLEVVGIPRERFGEYPHQFSGGMKQRVVIAMALACNPKLLLADEPTTALDVTIQAQVLETMKDLRKKFGSAMIMITHDLGIIAEVCDEVSVVYAGQIVEHGTLEDIFNHTMHPYTEGLFGSLPNIEDRKARLQPIPGLMPDPTNLPKGCPFSPRCKYCTEACKKDRPEKKWASDTHYVRCVRYEEPGFSIERSEQ